MSIEKTIGCQPQLQVGGAEEKWIRESSQKIVVFLKIFKLTRGKQ